MTTQSDRERIVRQARDEYDAALAAFKEYDVPPMTFDEAQQSPQWRRLAAAKRQLDKANGLFHHPPEDLR